MGHFARDCRAKGNQDNRRRDAGYNRNKARDYGRRPAYQDDSKALVTIDGEDIDWLGHVEEDTQNFAMMAYYSSNLGSVNEAQSCSKTCAESYARLKKLNNYLYACTVESAPKVVCEPKVWTDAIEEYESDSDDDLVSNVLEDKKTSFAFTDIVKHVKPSRENVKEIGTPNHCPKVEKHGRNSHTRKGLGYAFTRKACFVCGSFSHLIKDCNYHEKRMAKQAKLTKSKNKVTGQKEHRPVWNNVQRVNHQNKFVPSVLLTKTGKFPVNAVRQNFSRQAASTSIASKVNSARSFLNETRPKRYFYKSHSPNKRPFHTKIAQRTIFLNHKVNTVTTSLSAVKRNRDTAVKTSADYQEFKGGPVAFGGSNGRITSKGKIKAGRLDFEDVYYVEELKHYNLFSIAQMCDKKNKVLFTDTDFLVLSPDFKLPDENQVLLKILRQHNMYNFNRKNINSFRDLVFLLLVLLLLVQDNVVRQNDTAAEETKGITLRDDNHDGDKPKTSKPSQPIPPPTQQIPNTISSIKLPILKKGEYDIWAMKMEHYLSHTDYPIRKVIRNGNGPVSITTDTNGMINVLPPKTAKEEAIKSRFGGNDESKKMQKYLLKQQFEGFSVYASKGLHKGYDRFQTLLSQLEIHGASVSHEDSNQKFLRSLPSSWSQVALIMRTKPGLDTLSFDDLYNNLRVFKHDVKGTTASSSSNTKNVAFVSADNTSSTNDVNTAYSVSSPSVSKLQKKDLHHTLMKLFILSLQINQVAMISMSIKKFHKRTGRKLQFDTRDPVGFDKTKVECFNCHKIWHFARDYRAKENQDNKRRDGGYNGNKARDNGRRLAYQDDSKAWVTINGEDINWSRHVEEDTQNFAMMAYSSSNSGSDNETTANELDAQTSENATCESDSSVETTTSMPTPVDNAPKIVYKPKVWTDAPIIEEYDSDSDDDSMYNVQENIEKPSFAFIDLLSIFSHLIRDCNFHEKRMVKQAELATCRNKVTGQKEHRPIWNNVKRVNHQNKFVPSVLLTKTGKFPVNAARQYFSSQAASTSTASKVNTARPFMNETRPKRYFYKSHSHNKIPFHNKTTHRNTYSNHKINTVNTSLSAVKGNEDTAVKDLAGNKAYLADYQEFKGGSVAFGGSNERITGKGKIKAGRLDFEDVYHVDELKHYNLFFMSQMYDKKNKVLFTDIDCLVLSLDFKLPDENQVLLKIPRQNNMYSFNLKNIDPSRDLSCLFAKASIDESNKWHRKLGHVKGNLVRGIKREYSNARTPQQNEVAERKNKTLIEATRTMLAHLFLPTTFWAEEDLEKLKRQEKETNNAVRKEATHDTQDANTNNTNLLNAVRAPVSIVGPSRALNDGEPSYPNDPLMPYLEDIYASPSEGIFTNSSYDVEGVVTDFNNLETTVNTRSKVHKNSKARALSVVLYETIDEEVYVTQPLGFLDHKFPNKVYKVVKAIYGLHQAPRACKELASPKQTTLDGVECLPTEEIFTELARMDYEKQPLKLTFYKALFSAQYKLLIHTLVQCMSAKRTAWNEFGCSMASAVICLATGRKFNFSKYIFDSMVRNVDSPSKFLMYPRFLQVLITNQVDDLSSHTTKYTSPALSQKVFTNIRKIGKGFSGIETPLFNTMLVQPQAAAEKEDEEDKVPATHTPLSPTHEPTLPSQEPTPLQTQSVTPPPLPSQAQPAQPSSPPQAQPTTTSTSDLTLLSTLMETCTTLEQDKRLRKVGTAQRVESSTETVVGAQEDDQKQENIDSNVVAEQMQEKHLDNIKKYQSLKRKPVSVAQTRKNMIVYLKNMDGYKIAHFKRITYDQESFKKLKAEVEVSGSHSTQDTPTDDPKEMSKEDVKNMLQIIPVSELKVEALQVKYPLIDWEIYFEGSRTYWTIIRVGGITQAYRSFEDMVKDFDKEDLDALSDVFWKLQRYMHDPLTWKLYTNYGVHQVSLTRRNDIFMFPEKDYPLTDVVLLLMLSTKLQVNEDCEMAKDLVMKIFMEANKPNSRKSLDTSSNDQEA
nr:hypothetical protein [Tanacetum cinerariifolium]